MKSLPFFACAVVLLTVGSGHAAAAEAAAKTHHASKAHDWTRVVEATPDGGFVMGNPDAKVKLIEYGSLTCPHCREFDEVAVPHLINDYVKTGQVSWEFRNYVRDAVDLTAALIARCNGAKSFFPLTRALFKDQKSWIAKVQAAPKDQLEKASDLPPDQRFVELAKLTGFSQWAAAHGEPTTKSAQCLGNEQAVDALVKQTGDVTNRYPDFIGTPSFIIDGTMVDFGPITADQVWPTLESKLKDALAGHG
ncbi:MAG TPA: thioredoxin domain-containing protein [Sphingomicrobium sp.]|nr:thioredoxin domain-containing protein [Sphingomicrobium sp.]